MKRALREIFTLWVAWTVMCCVSVYFCDTDIKSHAWGPLAIDGPFTLMWFFAAHFAWEKRHPG